MARRIIKLRDNKSLPSEAQKKWNLEPYEEFISDMDETQMKNNYAKLRKDLSLASKKESQGHLINAMDSSANNYLDASDLYLIAEDQYRRYKIYFENHIAKLNHKAHKALEKLKADKTITGAITEALRLSWIIEHEEEDWNELHHNKSKTKTIRERMKELKKAWEGRLSSLQSQAKVVEIRRNILEKGKGN